MNYFKGAENIKGEESPRCAYRNAPCFLFPVFLCCYFSLHGVLNFALYPYVTFIYIHFSNFLPFNLKIVLLLFFLYSSFPFPFYTFISFSNFIPYTVLPHFLPSSYFSPRNIHSFRLFYRFPLFFTSSPSILPYFLFLGGIMWLNQG
jgi:hypothetical protein